MLVGVVIYLTTPKPGRREYWPLGTLLVVQLLRDVISTVVYHTFHVNTNPIISTLNLPVFVMIVLLYKDKIHWAGAKKIATALIICYSIFGLINFIFIQGIFNANSYTWLIMNVSVIIISLTYFYVLIQQLPTESITRLPMFWINTGMLILYSGTFVTSLAADYLIRVLNNNMITTLYINYLLAMIFYALVWRALLLIRAEHSVEK